MDEPFDEEKDTIRTLIDGRAVVLSDPNERTRFRSDFDNIVYNYTDFGHGFYPVRQLARGALHLGPIGLGIQYARGIADVGASAEHFMNGETIDASLDAASASARFLAPPVTALYDWLSDW